MAESISVNVPRAHAARFPNRCVACGAPDPDSHIRIVTGTLGWWTWVAWWWGMPFKAKAPACAGCSWRQLFLRLLSLVVTIATVVVAFWWIWPLFKEAVPAGLRRWAMMGLAIVCLLPQILFEVFFARPFDVTAYSESVDYEFTSSDYAIEFALWNADAAWVKVNGVRLPGSDDDSA